MNERRLNGGDILELIQGDEPYDLVLIIDNSTSEGGEWSYIGIRLDGIVYSTKCVDLNVLAAWLSIKSWLSCNPLGSIDHALEELGEMGKKELLMKVCVK